MVRVAPNSAPVRINELMPNPPGADAWGKEYVELRNNATVFDHEGECIRWAQQQINDLVAIFSLHNGGFVSIVDATHDGDEVSDPDLASGFSVVANHHFVLQLADTGDLETMSGSVTFAYERVTGTSFHLVLDGVLTSPSFQLDLHVEQDRSGFGTLSVHDNTLHEATWTQDGASYPYTNATSHLRTWIGQETIQVNDHREWTDWTGVPRVSDRIDVHTAVADGVHESSVRIVRSHPILSPPFDGEISLHDQVAVSEVLYTTTLDGGGLLDRQLSVYRHSFADPSTGSNPFAHRNANLRVRLQDGAQATLVEERLLGNPWDVFGQFEAIGTYPVAVLDPAGEVVEQKLYETRLGYDVSYVTSHSGAVEKLTKATATGFEDGQPTFSFSYAIDACASDGCGCGDPTCTCGAVDSSGDGGGEGGRGFWASAILLGAQGLSAGSCAMGAVGTGGLGAFAAGTLSFAAVELWDELVPGGQR